MKRSTSRPFHGRLVASTIGLLGCLIAILVASPGAAAAAQPQAVSIAAHTVRACPDEFSCTFVASGAIVDSGSISTELIRATALPAPVVGTAHYVRTFVGHSGSLTIRLQTIIGPTDVPWLWHEEGQWVVISGSGAYAGLMGDGRESGTRDFANQSLDVVYEGQLH